MSGSCQGGDPASARQVGGSGIAHILPTDRPIGCDRRRTAWQRETLGIDVHPRQRLARVTHDEDIACVAENGNEQQGLVAQLAGRAGIADQASKVLGARDQLFVGMGQDGGAYGEEVVGPQHAGDGHGDQPAQQGHADRKRTRAPRCDQWPLPTVSPAGSPKA